MSRYYTEFTAYPYEVITIYKKRKWLWDKEVASFPVNRYGSYGRAYSLAQSHLKALRDEEKMQ